MNQHSSSQQPPWHPDDCGNASQERERTHREEPTAGSPPPPPPPGPLPYGPGAGEHHPYGPYGPPQLGGDPHTGPPAPGYGPNLDPRHDPRWVYTAHDPTDESRPIPYFSGDYSGPDHYYQRRRRRRGPLQVFINGAGILAFAFLLLGFLALVFDWDTENTPLEQFFSTEPESPPAEVLPESHDPEIDLADQLDHVHGGIEVDWETGGQHTGPGLDPGQEVGAAPGIFMVDTQVYQYLGFGTGMVVSSDGLAITNYHVVESSMTVSITMADTNQRYSATVLGRDADRDIAVLQIDTEDQPLEVASINPGQVTTGDTVAGVGNAGGQGYLTSVVGEIQSTNETIHIEPQEPGSPAQYLEQLIMITSDIVPGYSGGPTVDSDGQVIAVSTAASQNTTDTNEAFGYAVPITNALAVVEQVLQGDDSGSVVIGAGGALGIVVSSEPGSGARVIEVSNGSAGAEIGLQPDDLILEIDGQEVVNSSFISRYVRDKSPGDDVDVVWQTADGSRMQATVELDEASIN